VDNKKSLKEKFPNLMKELEGEENKVKIDSVQDDGSEPAEEETSSDNETVLPDKFRHYNPAVLDFLRRCDTEAQAEEIITYLHKRGELTEDHACKLRTQLKKEGVRSFGSKKDENYYFKQGGIC
jgi:hypothetical protein